MKASLEKLSNDLARTRQSAEQQSAAFARELKTVSEQRDHAQAAASAAEQALKTSGIDEKREQADRAAAERITRLEREVTRLKRERDQLIEQRDELRDRIAGMADEQQRIVKEIALHATKTKPLPTDVIQKPAEERKSNVIEITEAELLRPGEADPGGVRPPQLRPVVIPPPNLRVL